MKSRRDHASFRAVSANVCTLLRFTCPPAHLFPPSLLGPRWLLKSLERYDTASRGPESDRDEKGHLEASTLCVSHSRHQRTGCTDHNRSQSELSASTSPAPDCFNSFPAPALSSLDSLHLLSNQAKPPHLTSLVPRLAVRDHTYHMLLYEESSLLQLVSVACPRTRFLTPARNATGMKRTSHSSCS